MKPTKHFPFLNGNNHRKTSEPTLDYNCIAWAAGDDQAWWWPDPDHQYYWPEGIPREATLTAFVQAYSTLGYTECEDNAVEKGFDKIAIYVKNGQPTHAARQLKSGLWTSKLGSDEDIEHALGALEGPEYGKVALYLKRPRATATSSERVPR